MIRLPVPNFLSWPDELKRHACRISGSHFRERLDRVWSADTFECPNTEAAVI